MSDVVAVERRMLGGRVGIHLDPGNASASVAERAATVTLDRLEAWSRRLTRFDSRSELSSLNAARRSRVAIRPTLSAVLDWARAAEAATDGIVTVALLSERLEAEVGARRPRRDADVARAGLASRRWSLHRGRRTTVVERSVGLRFDLDGVAKGWLADRAAARLEAWPVVAVDADGDVALVLAPGRQVTVGVADPFDASERLTAIEVANTGGMAAHVGVATSGTTVHRWGDGSQPRHHLLDPRTLRPAATDLVQVTVVASSARRAEALAKAAVIVGFEAAFPLLERCGCEAAVLVRDDGTWRWVVGGGAPSAPRIGVAA